ncbi:hypothetical protein Trydic_g4477 [Trypoxylus dichotomus]
MGARGKIKRGNHQHLHKKSKIKKPRKTYSLYDNSKPKRSEKRKVYNDYPKADLNTKKVKIENNSVSEVQSSDGEEDIDDLTRLRLTFKNTQDDNKAIESSDDTDKSDVENVNQTECNRQFQMEEYNNEKKKEDKDLADNMDDYEETNSVDEADNRDCEISDELDPFAKHLFYELSDSLLHSVCSTPMDVNTFNESWPYIGMINIQIPICKEQKQERKEGTIIEEKHFAPVGQIPKRIHLSKSTFETLCIKSQIINNLAKSNTSLVNKDKLIPLTPLQVDLFSIINNYQDLYYPQRNFDNGEEIRYVYCLHTINHILKTRTKIIHHNVALSKKSDVTEEFRDQGLVRPKVLIIVPFKNAAYRIIQFLINILITEDKGIIINKHRFLEDFTGNELIMPRKKPKPEDYELTFVGNSNDDFKIGISITKKSLKLYAEFYSSDIIISSPLGLRYIIGAEGEPERDCDFLASIELLILDQAEIFLMQNWDHVLHIMKHMHLQPKKTHGTDFSRVRTWSLNGWAKYYRQTLIFSSLTLPEINAIFNKHCANYAGKVKVIPKVESGSIRQVYVQLPHVFQKIGVNSVEHSIDARFNYFISKILPQQRDALMKQTLIYIASYFDYVKIRNYCKKEDISIVQICEYSKSGKIARARDMFFHGDAHFLLYVD